MVTLEKIVESIKLQLQPHLTEDQILHDSWLIEIVNISRAALLRNLYVAGDNFVDFYQEMKLDSVTMDTIEGTSILFNKPFEKIVLPTKLMSGIGKKNIQYLGSLDYSVRDLHYVSFDEFINYSEHRFGSQQPCYTDFSDALMIQNTSGQKKWLIRVLTEFPDTVSGYDYKTSAYPIGLNNLRQLEIITFQHLLPKIGLPTDILNNGVDETKGVGQGQQAQVNAQQQQIAGQQEQIDKNIKLNAQQLFDQRQTIAQQIEAQEQQSRLQQEQAELQRKQVEKQERMQAQQLFDQRANVDEQMDNQKEQIRQQRKK